MEPVVGREGGLGTLGMVYSIREGDAAQRGLRITSAVQMGARAREYKRQSSERKKEKIK